MSSEIKRSCYASSPASIGFVFLHNTCGSMHKAERSVPMMIGGIIPHIPDAAKPDILSDVWAYPQRYHARQPAMPKTDDARATEDERIGPHFSSAR